MSIEDLNTPIQILRLRFGRDRDGFPTESEDLIACVRAHIDLTTDMVIVCGADRYNIVSVENIRGRNLYTQVVARLESEES